MRWWIIRPFPLCQEGVPIIRQRLERSAAMPAIDPAFGIELRPQPDSLQMSVEDPAPQAIPTTDIEPKRIDG